MSDIVERLRASSHQHKDARAIRLEAADEIARLRARVEELEDVRDWVLMYDDAIREGNDADAVFHDMVRSARRALRGETDG